MIKHCGIIDKEVSSVDVVKYPKEIDAIYACIANVSSKDRRMLSWMLLAFRSFITAKATALDAGRNLQLRRHMLLPTLLTIPLSTIISTFWFGGQFDLVLVSTCLTPMLGGLNN
jgi:hypothetical protein